MLTVDFNRLGLQPGELLVDIGAGTGRHAREGLTRGATVVAIDLDQKSLSAAATSLDELRSALPAPRPHLCLRADALRLPFPDGRVDRVVISEVLEHIPDDRDAIAEAWRVLRPGGRLAVTVPRWLPEKVCWALSDQYHDFAGGHVRIYRGDELEAKVRDAGFQPLGRHHAHALHSPYWWLKCAVGVDNADHPAVRAYHRMLIWDMFKRPRATRLLERTLNPVLGKSLVLYFEKPAGGGRTSELAA